MRQLGELKRNAGQQFEEKGVKVVAVFREEKQGLDGLKRIKNKTKTDFTLALDTPCLLYTSPSPRDRTRSRMPSSA